MTIVGNSTWEDFQIACYQWVLNGSGLTSQQVVWGQQDAPRPAAPAIMMRISNIAETGRMSKDYQDNKISFTAKNVGSVSPSTDKFASTAHGLNTGDGPIHLASTGALPTAVGGDITAGVDYWVIAPDADHIQLARSYELTGGGQAAGNTPTPIDLTSAGSGVITIHSTANTVTAGAELVVQSIGLLRVTLELHAHSADGTGTLMATALLERVRARRELPSQQNILWSSNIGLTTVERVRAVVGVRDAALFEPRSYMDVILAVPVIESEFATFIEQSEITNQTTGREFTVSLV